VLTTSVLGWLLLGVLVFWAVGAYNRLVRLRSVALLAFGALDAQWLRHTELLSAAVPMPVLVPVTDGPVAAPVEPEPPVPTALAAASAQLMASLAVARSRPLERDAIAALAAARSVWDMAWTQALGASRTWSAESENRPQRVQFLPDLQPNSQAIGQKDGEKWAAAVDLQPAISKSDWLPGHGEVDRVGAQQRWELWATQAAAAQSQFNSAITQHNLAVNQFPAVVLARLFGFRPAGSL